MPAPFRVPSEFASEADEASWWFEHRDELTQAFEDAMSEGRVERGGVARRARERAAAEAAGTTITLSPGDVARASAG